MRLTSNLNPSELFRLNSYSRPYKSLAEGTPSLLDYSLYNDNLIFAIPELAILESYRVVVSTCVSAGIPHGLGFKRGHFTHIFIDEAGQATEPMAMIPILPMVGDSTNVTLAGDPLQLQPIVRSPLARDLGLKRSYLERLKDLPVYDEDTGKGVTYVPSGFCCFIWLYAHMLLQNHEAYETFPFAS
jgi:helicase MOV-10